MTKKIYIGILVGIIGILGINLTQANEINDLNDLNKYINNLNLTNVQNLTEEQKTLITKVIKKEDLNTFLTKLNEQLTEKIEDKEKEKKKSIKIEINGINKKTYLNLFNEVYNYRIGCYLNGQIYNKLKDIEEIKKQNIHCRGKNIIIPRREEAEIFWEMYKDEKNEEGEKIEYCGDMCISKISNRFALVNFESGFNANAISSTNDYGYIQVHNGKEFLGTENIKKSLYRLDERWKNQTNDLCINKYRIEKNNRERIYKCLLMRHNGRRLIDNEYSNRGNIAKKYYVEWFKGFKTIEKIEIINKN